jgi:hypothetical protein
MRGYVADTRWRFGKGGESRFEDRGAVMSGRAERKRREVLIGREVLE